MFVAGFVFLRAAVDGGVGAEEVSAHVSHLFQVLHFGCRLHGVQADGGQLTRNHLDREPPSLLKLMSLLFRYKAPPDIQVLHCPSIRASREDVVRQYVVVTECRHYWYRKSVCTTAVTTPSKNLGKLRNHVLVLLYNLLLRARNVVVIVVSRRVASPYNEVYVVFYIVVYPFERLVDESKGRVAARRLCAVNTRRATVTMACGV